MQKQKERIFTRFLKANKVFNPYINNLQEKYGDWKYALKYLICRKDLFEDLILHSFDWIDTEEGRDFWLILDARWYMYIKRFSKDCD